MHIFGGLRPPRVTRAHLHYIDGQEGWTDVGLLRTGPKSFVWLLNFRGRLDVTGRLLPQGSACRHNDREDDKDGRKRRVGALVAYVPEFDRRLGYEGSREAISD